MQVCEFLQCTLTELDKRITNLADYYSILAYIDAKNEKTNSQIKNR
jgi:hypothetical protein